MKKGFPLSYLFATVVLLAGLSQATAQQQATVSVDGTAAVLSVLSGLSAADNAGDLDAVVNHYRGDAILLPPNANVVTGSPAIRAWYEQGLFRHFRCEVSFDADETEASGDWAFARGYINGRLNPKADEPLIKLHEKFIMILRHDHDGWKIARLIWNSDEPAAAAAK